MADILHYRGDHTESFDPDRVLGPDLHRRYLTIKTMAYDPGANVSTATLRAVPPGEFGDKILPLIADQNARLRLKALFSG